VNGYHYSPGASYADVLSAAAKAAGSATLTIRRRKRTGNPMT